MKHAMKMLTAALMALLLICSMAACAPETVKEPVGTLEPTITPIETPVITEPSPTFSDADVDGELILDHVEELQYAQFFALTHYKGGYKMFTITGGEDLEYLIVPEGKSVPQNLAENVVVLQQPINRVTSASTSTALINAFGGLDRIATVSTEVENWQIDAIKSQMESGAIKYSGSYKEPDFEMLTAEGTQLVIDSTMLDSYPEIMQKYAELGIPCIVERSSKEVHPLGTSEWTKLYGAILGMWDEANAYFDAQTESIKAFDSAAKCGKTVALVYFSSDGTKVYARRGGDHYAAMINIAGGEYIMAGFEPDKTGVATVTNEEFYALCLEADYLINLNIAAKLYTMEELLAHIPIVADFKAVKEGNVYVARPGITQFTYDSASIIKDMQTIFNDATVEETASFSKMK